MAISKEGTDARIARVNAEIHQSTKGFNNAVQKITKLMTEDELLVFHRFISLTVLTKIVERTPVDTGRARGGWQTSAQGFIETENGNMDQSGQQVIAKGLSVINTLKPYSIFYISNAVPYISFLEDGHSRQSRDMVKLAIADVKGKVVQ